jgi:hypothetical protein
MTEKSEKPFASKRGQKSPEQIDPAIRESLERHAPKGELACAVAFRLVAELQKPPAAIGEAADLLGIRLVKCQLGLFGYTPEKKIVQAAAVVDSGLQEAIGRRLESGRLPCVAAWDLADAFKMSRMEVSAVCEALGVKIKPCQLGAF